MTDSPRNGAEPTEPLGNRYTGYPDPAYAEQSPNAPPYAPPYPTPNPTEPLPPYSAGQHGQALYGAGPYGAGPYGAGPYGAGPYGPYPPGQSPQEPPEPPKSPRWLWLLAAAAVLIVVGLVIALVIDESPSKQQTVVAPLPAMTEPSFATPSPTPTAPTPTPPILPVPTLTPPSESATPGQTDPVVYEVTGTGRAINITYVDSGNMMQTEFNVVLPWRKEVDLPKPAQDSASVTIINVGHDVTCTVTINGVQVQQRTGAGLTICAGSG
jgi:hypothetical protein